MRWKDRRASTNVEDRRGLSAKRGMVGGGIGTIVIAIAILPLLGVGGMQLYQAETPGAMKSNKLTPRILGTAGQLFLIYLALTACCALAYWLAGMDVFDAVAHSFSTVSVGGFSTHDANLGHFDNPLIVVISIVFMVLAALNFALHYLCWRQRSLRFYASDPEARFFLTVIAVLSEMKKTVLLAVSMDKCPSYIREDILDYEVEILFDIFRSGYDLHMAGQKPFRLQAA